jgi:ATP-dependent Lon protease
MTSDTPATTPASDNGVDELLNRHFAGKVVRKDLTKLIKEGANVPVYVLEYLLGMYCASDDEAIIRDGLGTVKTILAENYVRPDEAEKVKSKIKERGSYKVIDKVTVRLNEKRDLYEALLSNLGVKDAEIPGQFVKQFEKLLVGGIWCIVTLHYSFEEGQKGSPFTIGDLKPIQMPNLDLEDLCAGRRGFTEGQWLDVLCRSTGMEPANLTERVKWHLLARLVPFVENNYNCCELGPRGHRQEPSLQGDQPQQYPHLRRPDHGGQSLLQPGPAGRGPGGPLGPGGLRRGGGHLLQGQGWGADHEGLHGLRLLRPGSRRRPGRRQHGLRG